VCAFCRPAGHGGCLLTHNVRHERVTQTSGWHGAQFGAWIGLTPRQRSSGGKSNLGGITKRGDTYLRTLLIQGAKSAVMTARRRQDKLSHWVVALRERSGWQKAVVALANKNARILWAVMTRGEAFDANHLSVKPAGA
jgi:transposase